MNQVFNLADFVNRAGEFNETDLSRILAAWWPSAGVMTPGPWLAGGAVRRTLLGESVIGKSDIDLFFLSDQQRAQFALHVLLHLGFKKVAETDKHEHYRGIDARISPNEIDVQLIKFAYFPTVDAVLDSFDFTICQFAVDGETLVCGEFSLWDLGRKRLVVHRTSYPAASLRRMLKYARQGFYVCSGAISKILADTIASPELQARIEETYVD